jgi:hypothetical protein
VLFRSGVIVGALIAYATSQTPEVFWPAFLANSLWVGSGEFVVLFALGLPALILLPKTRLYKSLAGMYE